MNHWRCLTCGTVIAVRSEHVTATCSHRDTRFRLRPPARMVRVDSLPLDAEESA